MIARFRHRGLERLFTSGDTSGINAQHVRKLRQILVALNNAANPAAMNLPGFRLHPLRGDRRGQWAVSVSGNWPFSSSTGRTQPMSIWWIITDRREGDGNDGENA
jgi:proteic killer suppression protein